MRGSGGQSGVMREAVRSDAVKNIFETLTECDKTQSLALLLLWGFHILINILGCPAAYLPSSFPSLV